MQETGVLSLGGEDPLEEERAAHSRILAWRSPRTEEPGGLESTGPQSRTRLGDQRTDAHTCFAVVCFVCFWLRREAHGC